MDKDISKDFIFGEYVVSYKVKTKKKFKDLPKINTSLLMFEVFDRFLENKHFEKEYFYVMYLTRALNILSVQKISEGSINGTIVDVPHIFRYALNLNAACISLCHNHPSENKKPSEKDIELTKKIKAACTFHDITLIDHIIYCGDDYYSFADEQIL